MCNYCCDVNDMFKEFLKFKEIVEDDYWYGYEKV